MLDDPYSRYPEVRVATVHKWRGHAHGLVCDKCGVRAENLRPGKYCGEQRPDILIEFAKDYRTARVYVGG